MQSPNSIIDYGSDIQRERKTRLLRHILRRTKVSRAELAELTGLSQSSVVKYVKSLLEGGIIREDSVVDSHSGRRVQGLEFDPSIGLSIAVVLTANVIDAYLVDPTGVVLTEAHRSTYQNIPREVLIERIVELASNLRKYATTELESRIFGVGIGLGGYLDPSIGVSHQYLFSRNWDEVPLPHIVGAELGLPSFIINDANAVALGEMLFGKAAGASSFFTVWLGEGIGMGIVVAGELYEGASSYAGEIGHTRAVSDGELCYCGHRGCLETVSSQRHIVEQFDIGKSKGVHTQAGYNKADGVDRVPMADLIAAANDGDRFVRNIFNDVASHVAEKVADIANVLNPEQIVFRGPVVDNNRYLHNRLSQELEIFTLQPIWESMRVSYYEGDEDHIQARGLGSYVLLRQFA